METLFENTASLQRPLSYNMRPATLDEYVGQDHLVSEGKQLRKLIESKKILSMIFFGPPGSGKTALSNIIAEIIDAKIQKINAVNSSVKEIRDIIKLAKINLQSGQQTLLIIDEIHRFNRGQQESLLPDVEAGNIVIVGITTENPFYFISGPLISRARVFKFNPLSNDNIEEILGNCLKAEEKGLGSHDIDIDDDVIKYIASISEGDARFALNVLEMAFITADSGKDKTTTKISQDIVESCLGEKKFNYDRTGDQHYNTISAFIKSMRGSDPDAAVYYLAKMILSGEDPRFIARRMAILAAEDIGNADPQALILSNSALSAVEYIGMPESRIILAQVAIYLACAPKSNASYVAIDKAISFAEENSVNEVPAHLTKAGKKDYKYPHSFKDGYVKQNYMINEHEFYSPSGRGHEKLIRQYMDYIKNRK